MFHVLKVKFSLAKIIKIIFLKETFLKKITLFEDYKFILKIKNSRLVKKISPKQ